MDYYVDYSDSEPDDTQVQVGFNKGGSAGGSVATLSAYTRSPRVIELDKDSNFNNNGQWMFLVSNDNIEEPRPSGGEPRPISGAADEGKFCGSVCIAVIRMSVKYKYLLPLLHL